MTVLFHVAVGVKREAGHLREMHGIDVVFAVDVIQLVAALNKRFIDAWYENAVKLPKRLIGQRAHVDVRVYDAKARGKRVTQSLLRLWTEFLLDARCHKGVVAADGDGR